MKEFRRLRLGRSFALVLSLAMMFALSIAWTALADNPHAEGEKGNPHAEGATGDPHAVAKAPAPPADKGRSESAPNGKAKGHSKAKSKAAPKSKSKGKGSAPKSKGSAPKSKGGSGSKGQSGSNPAGKTTLCHATGSETNPYVTITISNHAVEAHRRHQHGEDIIPAPSGGCPGGTSGGDNPGTPGGGGGGGGGGNENAKVTLCHATGSETNPYVVITISDNALDAHLNHQDGEDIYPVPAAGCPGPAGTTPTTPGITPTAGPLPPGPGTETTTTPGDTTPLSGVAPVLLPGAALPATGETPTSGVLDETAEGGTAPATAPGSSVAPETAVSDEPAAQRTADADDSGKLPFTGFEALAVLLFGIACLAGGVALRRLSRPETY